MAATIETAAPWCPGRDPDRRFIEDACAYAWLELVARQPERTNIIGGLRVVAGREAISLAQYDRRLGYGEIGDRLGMTPRTVDLAHGGARTEKLALGARIHWSYAGSALRSADRRSSCLDAREALAHMAALPERKRTALTLQVSGLTRPAPGRSVPRSRRGRLEKRFCV